MGKKKYYRIPKRLTDVIALIQVLAFDQEAKRSVNGLESELQGPPQSANTWTDIVLQHPEFFRLHRKMFDKQQNEGNAISLIARHVLPQNANGEREPLSLDLTKKLFEIAIELHDKEEERASWWKHFWPPMTVAIITVLGSFFIQYNNNENQAELKHYEVELKPKQEGYANYMQALSQSYFAANERNSERMVHSLDRVENYFYILEPFLSTYDRDRIWKQYQKFNGLCYTILQSDSIRSDSEKSSASFLTYKNFFRNNLYVALFSLDSVKVSGNEMK